MFYSGMSDVGMKRSTNQDNYKIKEYPSGALLGVVCDGMGGVAGGQIASALAVSVFISAVDALMDKWNKGREVPDENSVAEALLEGVYNANKEVYTKAREDSALEGMGTTLVASLIIEDKIYTINVGDSRMYLSDSDRIVQITHDHSYVQYLVDIGKMTQKEAQSSVNKNIITRAVGTEEDIEPDIYLTEIDEEHKNEKLRIVLCTDGLTNHVSPDKIYKMINDSGHGEEAIRKVTKELVESANKNGGSDNITVIIIEI